MYLASFILSFLCCFSTFSDIQKVEPSSRYTVYFFLLDECKISNEYGPELNKYYEKFRSEEIKFVGIFPNFSSKKENIQHFKSKYNIEFELKTDYYKSLSQKLDAKILPEVFVYDNHHGNIVYRGRIDDRYVSIGKRRRVIRHHDLRDVLNNISTGNRITSYRTDAIGCLINFNDNL